VKRRRQFRKCGIRRGIGPGPRLDFRTCGGVTGRNFSNASFRICASTWRDVRQKVRTRQQFEGSVQEKRGVDASLRRRDGRGHRLNQDSIAGSRERASRPGIVRIRLLEYFQGEGSKQCNGIIHALSSKFK
jgi:hypothetical protein